MEGTLIWGCVARISLAKRFFEKYSFEYDAWVFQKLVYSAWNVVRLKGVFLNKSFYMREQKEKEEKQWGGGRDESDTNKQVD